ncbi:MAG TPA: fibronectin type III domain-containing protein [Terriglobales bacterium]|nr:fibronectin type III domain-containing protein [Terriglobales bacterium]
MFESVKIRSQKKKQLIILWFVFLFTFLLFSSDLGQQATLPPSPPTDVIAKDTPNDAGGSITISWKKSPDDAGAVREENKVKGYEILRSTQSQGEYQSLGQTTAGSKTYFDTHAQNGVFYYYKVRALGIQSFSESLPSESAKASAQWLDWRRKYTLLLSLILALSIIYFINQAKSGKELFIRKIAGLEAVEEAVGRATEMGRKIFYIPGISDMDNMQTIAGVTILGQVAKKTAEYEAKLEVPVSRSLVMVSCRETIKEAYSNAGRPDLFNEDMVYYLTDDQFGYTAAVDGLFVREKPAAVFLQGQFYAESLILAETGNYVGAIQIAGTAQPAQLPFFVAACDYTLIGEELFAASAYLSRDHKLLGSLKGQDVGKFIFLFFILVGSLFVTFGIYDLSFLFR